MARGGATIIGDSLPQKSGIASRHLSLYLERLNGAAASGVSTIRQPHFVASEEGHFDPGQVLEILILASLVKKIRT